MLNNTSHTGSYFLSGKRIIYTVRIPEQILECTKSLIKEEGVYPDVPARHSRKPRGARERLVMKLSPPERYLVLLIQYGPVKLFIVHSKPL